MKFRFLYIALFLLICYQFESYSQTDSLRNALQNAKGQERIEILHLLVYSTWLNEPDSAQKYGEEALSIAKKLNDQQSISKSLRLLGGTYNYQGKPVKALEYNNQSLEIANNINDTVLIYSALNNIGFVYISLENYHNALEYLMRSYKIKHKLNITIGQEHTLNNIGLVYMQARLFDSAHYYFQSGLEVAKQNNEYDVILYSHNNIGNAYVQQSKYHEARPYFQAALRSLKSFQNKNWEAVALQGMGEILLHEEKFDSAFYYFRKSSSIRKSIRDPKGMGKASLWLARLSLKQNQINQSLDYLNESDSIAKAIKAEDLLLDIYQEKSKVYSQLHDYEKSNEFLLKSLKLKDSLYVNALRRNLSLVPLKLKENESLQLLKASKIELKEKELLNMVYVSLLVLAIPFTLLMILIVRRNRKINKTLEKQNNKVESQNEEIETQKEYLELNLKELERVKNVISSQKDELEVLNGQLAGTVDKRNIELQSINDRLRTTSLEFDNFIYKSSHDIKGPISRLMGICDLAMQDVEDHKALQYFSMLDKAALRLNIIIDELKLISELQDKVLENSKIDFRTIVQETFNEAIYIENISDFDLKINIEDNLVFYSDKSLIRLVIFNIIQNSLQFMKSENLKEYKIEFAVSQQARSIKIVCKALNLQLVGEESKKLMNGFSKAQNEFGNISIGLYTVKQCMLKLDGKFSIDSSGHNDTSFEIVLPKTI